MAIIVSPISSTYEPFLAQTSGKNAKTSVSPVGGAEGSRFDEMLSSLDAGKKTFSDASCVSDANYVKFSSLVSFLSGN